MKSITPTKPSLGIKTIFSSSISFKLQTANISPFIVELPDKRIIKVDIIRVNLRNLDHRTILVNKSPVIRDSNSSKTFAISGEGLFEIYYIDLINRRTSVYKQGQVLCYIRVENSHEGKALFMRKGFRTLFMAPTLVRVALRNCLGKKLFLGPNT